VFIELKGGTKKYGEGETCVMALNCTDFFANQGEICVVLGPSGSGKSTLLNILGGLDTLDSGDLTVGDKKISDFRQDELTEYRRSDVGFVFQSYNLITDLTVQENIEVVSDIAESPLDIGNVLEALEITELKYRFPRELSGGQQQRVAIARSLIKNPKILLCDELTGALDSKASEMVLRLICKINKLYRTTIVVITHNEAIAGIANQIVRIKDGRIVSNEVNHNPVAIENISL
jgi:putative ABC transport system ATP-binding protein